MQEVIERVKSFHSSRLSLSRSTADDGMAVGSGGALRQQPIPEEPTERTNTDTDPDTRPHKQLVDDDVQETKQAYIL